MAIESCSICPRCEQAHGGAVDCEGRPVDWDARRERARQFVKQDLKKGHAWTEKVYSHDTPAPLGRAGQEE